MNKPTQADLMSAHKQARQSAHEAAVSGNPADAPIEIESKPKPFPDYAHPFSGNENNKRVAQRIAQEKVVAASPVVVKPAQIAAQEALDAAEAFEAENPDFLPQSDDPDGDGGSTALIAAGLGGRSSAPTILPPAPALPQSGVGGVPPPPLPSK